MKSSSAIAAAAFRYINAMIVSMLMGFGKLSADQMAMSPVPASAITIADGEIAIDAELLAPKLGFSAAALKAEMRKGIFYSVAETGINEGAGRTRAAFRYRTRAWIVVVDPDGT